MFSFQEMQDPKGKKSVVTAAPVDTRPIKRKDFTLGEELDYKVRFSFMGIGEAKVKVDTTIHRIGKRPCYKVEVHGFTTGVMGAAYSVDDYWRSYIDTSRVVTQQFERDISENKYLLKEMSYFNHKDRKVVVEQKKGQTGEKKSETFSILPYTQDLISGYFYLRTLDFTTFKKGDTISMPAFLDDELYQFNVRYLGKDRIKTDFGKIDAFEMAPIMPENKLFRGDDPIRFWVSADANRVPVKIKAEMFVGSAVIELVEHKGLRTELGSDKK